jgi:hypothetical protein
MSIASRFSTLPRVVCLFVICANFVTVSTALLAQDVTAAPTTGSISGHVYCADTQKPARFAQVRLVPIPQRTPGMNPRAILAQRGGVPNGMSATDVEGSFTLTGVQPGDYYVDVTSPGYMQPLHGALNLNQLTPAVRDKLNSVVTRVSVGANQTTNVQVTVYRGGVLTGTLLYDDGSPATNVQVSAMVLVDSQAATPASSDTPTTVTFRQVTFERTGDRGQFRLAGLPDGSYTVVARPVGARGLAMMPIYYGNTLHRAEAKRVDVKAGDERGGMDIQIPTSTLRIVSGTVQSADDGHGLARTTVALTLTGEDGESINTTSAADGGFRFNSVQDGKFSVSANGSPEVDIEVKQSDVTGLVINVPAANAPAE